MSDTPKISIIIPIYKAEKYLDKCVRSVVDQTYKNLEIILIDDGSPDNCPAMCDAFAQQDDRIKVIHKENGGVSAARNAGLGIATGEYVGFIDSDDWINLDTCEYLLDMIKEYDADISYAAFGEFDAEKRPKPFEGKERIEIWDYDRIVKNMSMYPCWTLCCKLYKRSLFEHVPDDIPQNIVMSEDIMLNNFIYKSVNKMVGSNVPKYFYFRHLDSAIAGVITERMIDDSHCAYMVMTDTFDKSSPLYPYQIANRIKNDFWLLNSIIRNQKCLDRYDMLRDDIVKNKSVIFWKDSKSAFSKKQKIGALLLIISPRLYDKSILVRRGIRGY